MTAKLACADGKALYALRRQTIEPVFGQIKDNRGARRFLRRGLAACEAVQQHASTGQSPRERAMRMRMTSLVPSPISRILASR
jgi:Transposase DDE domain